MNKEGKITLLKCFLIIFLFFLPNFYNAISFLFVADSINILNTAFIFDLNIFSAISWLIKSMQVIFPIFLLIVVNNESFEIYGFTKIGPKDFIISLLRLFGIYFSILLIFGMINMIHNKGLSDEIVAKALNDKNANNSMPMILLNIVPIIFVAFSEELCFRSYFYRNLNNIVINKWICITVVNLIFATCHIYQGIIPSIQMFIFGIMLNIEFEKHNNIFTIVIFHSLNNIFVFMMRIIIREIY